MLPICDSYKGRLRDYFAQRGGKYDEANTFHPKLAERLLQLAPLRPGSAVLDVATGTGYVALLAAEAVGSNGLIICIDMSSVMLRQV